MTRPGFGAALSAAMLLFALATFAWLPDAMPLAWDRTGAVVRRLPRFPGAFTYPAAAFTVWLLLRTLARLDPGGDDGGFRAAYWLVANLILLMIAIVHVATVGAGLGWSIDALHIGMLTVASIFLGLGDHLPRARPGAWIGIRTPWTLASERVWTATHRVAGRSFTTGGVLTLAAAMLPDPWRPWVAVSALTFASLIPVFHSYHAARRRPTRAEP